MTTTLEFRLEAHQKDNGRWYWLIRHEPTGKVLENDRHGSNTEQECRDEGAPYIGDWYAGHRSIEAPPASKDTEEWMQRTTKGHRRMTADEGYRKAISRRGF